MDRLTKKVMDKYLLPTIPMEINSKEKLDEFHEVRRFYENCVIRLGGYEDTGLTPERCAELAETENNEKYTDWLENMVILLAKCYQETHDMLLEKAKNEETDAYFSMPRVQGLDMVINVDKISQKATNKGSFTDIELEGYVNWLIDQHPNPVQETKENEKN